MLEASRISLYVYFNLILILIVIFLLSTSKVISKIKERFFGCSKDCCKNKKSSSEGSISYASSDNGMELQEESLASSDEDSTDIKSKFKKSVEEDEKESYHKKLNEWWINKTQSLNRLINPSDNTRSVVSLTSENPLDSDRSSNESSLTENTIIPIEPPLSNFKRNPQRLKVNLRDNYNKPCTDINCEESHQ